MRTFAETRNRRLRGSLLVAALLASACAAPTRPAPVELPEGRGFRIGETVHADAGQRAALANALRLLDAQRHDEAIAALIALTEEAPRLVAPHIDLAIAYGRVGELERAQASLERALALDPRHPVAYNELGILYRRKGRFQEARASYEKALALHPEFHFARKNLAILCDLYLADRACALENYELYSRALPADESAAIWVRDLRARGGR